jgi:hypothetical protein
MKTQGFRAGLPLDPYHGSDYGYEQRGGDFMVWSHRRGQGIMDRGRYPLRFTQRAYSSPRT